MSFPGPFLIKMIILTTDTCSKTAEKVTPKIHIVLDDLSLPANTQPLGFLKNSQQKPQVSSLRTCW